MKDEELKKYLDFFATKNQYSNWKSVLKDKQSMSFTAKEFEEEARECFQKGRQSKLKEVLKIVEELKKVADENDMEIAIDDGEKDGFRVIDFSEYIEREFSLLSQLEDDEVKK